MRMNVASWDRVVRIVIGTALLVVAWSGGVTGWQRILLFVLGALPLLTGLIGWCPLYSAGHVQTRKA